MHGFSPRGMDVDRNGVVWAALASGHLASFDRRKCRGPLNGPKATGQHCPEGWTLYPEPLPQLAGVTDSGSAEASYYTWVDQFDTFGLGTNIPINTGNASEGLLALKDGKWVVLRVPYPVGYYTKWLDGRIDDPKGGWKGRGLWSTVSTRTPFHMETGKGTTSKVMQVPAPARSAREMTRDASRLKRVLRSADCPIVLEVPPAIWRSVGSPPSRTRTQRHDRGDAVALQGAREAR